MGILKPVMVSTGKGPQLSHSLMVGCHSLFGSNFDFRMTYFEFFGFFQKSQNMSHGNGSSAFVFKVMGILKPVTVSTDKGLQLSNSPMVGCNSLYGSNIDFRMTYFASRYPQTK